MFSIASKSLLDLTEADYYELTSRDNYDDMKPSLRYCWEVSCEQLSQCKRNKTKG
jgi:hypothetical protein